jgi:two-component system sensor histidine kinase/response regulator
MTPEETEQIKNARQITTTPGTEGEKGSGLGLIISKEFISKHQGELIVESQYGKGSTLGFIIPLKQQS